MREISALFFLLTILLTPCYGAKICGRATEQNDCSFYEQNFIQNPDNSGNRIEFFIKKPEGQGPFPVIFLLHGHQRDPSVGGVEFFKANVDSNFIQEGIAVVAISIPGFGNSGGNRDFSGPNSQKAIASVIDHCSKFHYIDAKRMGVYGISKGATLASMIPAHYPTLTLQILEAGRYDLTTYREDLPDYLEAIKTNITTETGGSESALKERSALYNTRYITGKTLLLAGEFDDRRTVPTTRQLHKKLSEEGKESEMVIYPNQLHILSAEKWQAIIPFVRKHLLDLHGIGIHCRAIGSAIQVDRIISGSAADLQGKLKIGDVVLCISPSNDDTEINALSLPISKFVQLVIGKKGSSIRLHVQHFDQTCEDIILTR